MMKWTDDYACPERPSTSQNDENVEKSYQKINFKARLILTRNFIWKFLDVGEIIFEVNARNFNKQVTSLTSEPKFDFLTLHIGQT